MAALASTWKYSAHDAEAVNLLRESLTKQTQTLNQDHPTALSNTTTLLEWETEVTRENKGGGKRMRSGNRQGIVKESLSIDA